MPLIAPPVLERLDVEDVEVRQFSFWEGNFYAIFLDRISALGTGTGGRNSSPVVLPVFVHAPPGIFVSTRSKRDDPVWREPFKIRWIEIGIKADGRTFNQTSDYNIKYILRSNNGYF